MATPPNLPAIYAAETASAVVSLNRQNSRLVCLQALAEKVGDLSSGESEPDRLEEISELAEAMQYQIEECKQAMARLATKLHQIDDLREA